jgi:hypothetical protein
MTAGGDGGNRVVQSPLVGPTPGEFGVLGPGLGGLLYGFVFCECLGRDIVRTPREELAQRGAGGRFNGSRFERGAHVLQPRALLGGADAETRVRLAQAEPASGLRVVLVAAEKLNQERRELIRGAAETLAREQRTKDRVLAHARIKLRR